MWMQSGRTLAIARKEVYHILRDPFTLGLSIGLPIFLVCMFGLVIEFNTKNLPLAVFDADQTESSRRVVENFNSSHYFITRSTSDPESAHQAIASEKQHAALIFKSDFQRNVFSGKKAEIQVLLDGSDNSTVAPILSYLSSIQTLASANLSHVQNPQILKLKPRLFFNPELNSRWFVIPGLSVVVMAILSILLTALTVAREWENGSMELLLSTPVKPIEIIVGKLSPYAVMGLIAMFFIYVMSRWVFEIPFYGNHLAFALGALIFLITYLAQGLLISVLTRKQQIAMQFAMMSGMIPSQLLSGFVFPIESMPTFFQYFTMIFPARWYMVIARHSYLRGSLFLEMSSAFLGLAVLCFVMVMLATRNFKKDLEP